MSAPIQIDVEGRLRFTFERPDWEAVPWDTDPAYMRGLRESEGKAVDIVATRHHRALHLIEVKDPRGDTTTYRGRYSNDEVAQIVADKVRDTIAGLVFARGRFADGHLLPHLRTMFDRDERIIVVLWLESFELEPTLALTLTTLIKRKLSWLRPKVVVTSRELWRGMPGLLVESMQGAPWRG